jgi:hypothetical protein
MYKSSPHTPIAKPKKLFVQHCNLSPLIKRVTCVTTRLPKQGVRVAVILHSASNGDICTASAIGYTKTSGWLALSSALSGNGSKK